MIEIKNGYAVMMFTDRFELDTYPLSEKTEQYLAENFKRKLLDMRVFDAEIEYRVFRGDVGQKLHERILKDNGEDQLEDEQYLDIDTIASAKSFQENHMVKATGGGCYRLPQDGFHDMKVKIKKHIAYEPETGQAYIRDWRLVDFFVQKEDKSEKRDGR